MTILFHWPVGSEAERATFHKLPGEWHADTFYAQRYDATGEWAIHTGLDMNLDEPYWNSDAHSPVYVAADGTVKFAGGLRVWGNVIVVQHDDHEGHVLYTRYAHVEQMQVKLNDLILRGEMIARVGNANGRYPYHLHYDMALIDLGAHPSDWPGDKLARVQRDYLDPITVMLEQLNTAQPGDTRLRLRVKARPSLRLRVAPAMYSKVITNLPTGTIVVLLDAASGEWAHVQVNLKGQLLTGWAFAAYLDKA